MSKTSYEQFINKKWVERKNVFETNKQTKKTFITREKATWKKISQTQEDLFMKLPSPAPSKIRIGCFFNLSHLVQNNQIKVQN